MNNLEFILSLNPKQIIKLLELTLADFKEKFNIGIIITTNVLFYQDKNIRKRYRWINNKWKEDNE
jgi:hypothetical protein